MRRRVVALGWLLLMPAAARAGETLATSCPAYPAHLYAARAALVRGDRVAATGELRRALLQGRDPGLRLPSARLGTGQLHRRAESDRGEQNRLHGLHGSSPLV